jgi:uncharacterized protein (TIGR02145 family)
LPPEARNARCCRPLKGRQRDEKAIPASAQLGGNRNSNGDFNNLGNWGNYWSATEHDADHAWNYNFNSNNGKLNRNNNLKSNGHSCRCLQDSCRERDLLPASLSTPDF